jgi:hypothetical protein
MAVALPVFYSSVDDLKKNYVNSRHSSSLSYCVVFKNFTSSQQQNSAASDILTAKRMLKLVCLKSYFFSNIVQS